MKQTKIKPNQIWKNLKTGQFLEIMARHKNGYWSTRSMRYNQGIFSRCKVAHHVRDVDLLKYWEFQEGFRDVFHAPTKGRF